MTERAEDRGVGQGYPPGETRVAIIRFLMAYPGGIEEKKIRDWLKETRGISEKGSIIEHLTSLKKRGLLILQSQRGKPNIWKLNSAQRTQYYISAAMLKGDIDALVHKQLFSDQENGYTITLFNRGYMQKAIDTIFLPLFKECYGIDPAIEEKLPGDLLTFIEKGFKMSPTAVLTTLVTSSLMDVTVGMFTEILYKNTTRKLDKVALAVITLYACILTDGIKYCLCPGVENKIRGFLREPHIISAISEWVGWDFTNFDSAPVQPEIYRIITKGPVIKEG